MNGTLSLDTASPTETRFLSYLNCLLFPNSRASLLPFRCRASKRFRMPSLAELIRAKRFSEMDYDTG